jgi:hypothetical protein
VLNSNSYLNEIFQAFQSGKLVYMRNALRLYYLEDQVYNKVVDSLILFLMIKIPEDRKFRAIIMRKISTCKSLDARLTLLAIYIKKKLINF